MNTIISEQTILLREQYDFIKTTINQDDDFKNLLKICRFNDEQKTLTFKTEKIHPENTEKMYSSIMFLFSNPHPLSVKTGIFLSEPRSRSFWQRLFECKHITVPEKIEKVITNWDSETPEILSEYLLNSEYSGRIKLFFDCLEALPTSQYGHLKKLFPKKTGQALRKQALQNPGLQNLVDVSQQNNIKSWIVFSAEAYRYLVGETDVAKNALKRICMAIDDCLENNDTLKFWDSLKDLKRTVQYETCSITVYLALIARCKNWKTKNSEKYFTIMLNQILDDILKCAQQKGVPYG